MIEFYLLSIMVMTEMNLLYPRDCIERSNHGFIWGSKSFNISLFLLAKVLSTAECAQICILFEVFFCKTTSHYNLVVDCYLAFIVMWSSIKISVCQSMIVFKLLLYINFWTRPIS